MIKRFYILVIILLLAGCGGSDSGSEATTPFKAWFPDLRSDTYSEEVFIGGDLSGYKGGKAIGNGSIEIYNSLTDQKITAELLTQQECHDGGYVWFFFFIFYIDDYCSSDEMFAAVVPVDIGMNEITAEVLDNLGTVVQSQSYSIERHPRILLTLSDISIEETYLDPIFDADIISYSADTCFKDHLIHISPTVNSDYYVPFGSDVYADDIVLDSNKGSIDTEGILEAYLNEGANKIELHLSYDYPFNLHDRVLGNKYTLNIKRGVDTEARLMGLDLASGILDKNFDPDITSYTAYFDYSNESAQITASTEDPCADITIGDISATQDLTSNTIIGEGSNLIEISIDDGVATRTYDITAVRGSVSDFIQSDTITPHPYNGRIDLSKETVVTGSFPTWSGPNQLYSKVNIYTRDSDNKWHATSITSTDFTDDVRFGNSVAISNDTIVIGSSGHSEIVDGRTISSIGAAYVTKRDETGAWEIPQYIEAPNRTAYNYFGSSVTVHGDRIAIASSGEDRGAVYTYMNSITCPFCDSQRLTTSDIFDNRYGVSLDMSENLLVVGSPNEEKQGSVYVYIRDESGIWIEDSIIRPPVSQDHDSFGQAVAVSGDTIVIGAPREDGGATHVDGDEHDNNAPNSGAVYVYVRDADGTWTKQVYIKASNADTSDYFGRSVDIDNDTLVVGAIYEDSKSTGVNGDETDNSAQNSGAAYIFKRDTSGDWAQTEYIKASDTSSGSEFGYSVSIDGELSVISSGHSGAFYVFD